MRVDAGTSSRKPLGLTPLIDVIFLLLLFFMLASTFSTYARIDVGGAPAGIGTGSVPRILLRVHADGKYDINGIKAEREELTTRLQAFGSAAEASDQGAPATPQSVAVVAVGEASVDDLVGAVEAARSAGLNTVLVAQ